MLLHELDEWNILKWYKENYIDLPLEKNNIEIDQDIEKSIKESGKQFISRLFKNDFKPEVYSELTIVATYLHYYSLYFYSTDKTGYIVIGVNYESIISKLEGIGDVGKVLSALKNLSDGTRFEILKLLLKKNYFGQELAAELNITTATVSYHMNQLFACNLVEIDRMEHKALYKLNKSTIKKILENLNREFEL